MRGWSWRNKIYPGQSQGDNVRRTERILKFFKNIKTWQLFLLLVLAIMLAVIFLRLNSIGAIERYEALKSADKTGDVAKVEAAAKNLQNYVTRHMNSTVPAVALNTLYEQAVQEALDVAKTDDIDETLYQKVTEECASVWYSGGSKARAKCIAERIGTSTVEYSEPELITPDAFYVQYASARWSPDAAGFMVLLCFILTITIIVRIIAVVLLKIVLRFKYRSV